MAVYPEWTEEFTNDLKQMVVGDRTHVVVEALAPFDPDAPVGLVMEWDETRVIIRVDGNQWQFRQKENVS